MATLDPVELLEQIAHLMSLKGENPFKIRAFEKGAAAISGRDDLAALAKDGKLTTIAGIGKGIADVLTEFLLRGESTALRELQAAMPPGLLELTRVPGLGPKKALKLIEELGIETLGELEYACRENRIARLTGFGEKLQQKIFEGIQFMKAGEGQQRLVDAQPLAARVLKTLRASVDGARVSETGEIRRQLEVVTGLDFLVELPSGAAEAKRVKKAAEDAMEKGAFPMRLHFAEQGAFGSELARTTATDAHWKAIEAPAKNVAKKTGATEEQFYQSLGLPCIPPEMRETGEEVALARSGKLDQVLGWDSIRGVFHNHTTRSDGVASLEQMVVAARKRGYEYIGISDHSKSAVYARGLTDDVLKEQEKEVREVQEKHPDVRIFWGIESDILADGSLDYEDKILKRFDFVIGSVHSRFKMDCEAMTDRMCEAIRNPYIRFVGHLTGRLLLDRKGYDLDMERVIAAAADAGVAIEMNANPARLDIDWRWGAELRKRKVFTSINPDAHATSELEYTRFGIAMARKALMPAELVLNTRSAKDVEKWLKRT
jgi:DNA polymerase (family 10)